LEVTLIDSSDQEILSKICVELKTEFNVVKDQVGMVTPRIIAMIINEAYEALQQGVASRKDIDLSMKLGTHYPFGPFEWADKIGLENLRKLLKDLEKSTGDSRYRSNL
jgi:3-hydroxybutyryl-CoA dehydrogenase